MGGRIARVEVPTIAMPRQVTWYATPADLSVHARREMFNMAYFNDHDHHAVEPDERQEVPPVRHLWVIAHELGMNVILLHAYLLYPFP